MSSHRTYARWLVRSAVAMCTVAQVARAQAPVNDAGAAAAQRFTLSMGAGPTTSDVFGVCCDVAAHGLLALGYAPLHSPIELRGDLMTVSSANRVGYLSISADLVFPVTRLVADGGVVRPYLLAGMGAYGIGSLHMPQRMAANGGGGVQFTRNRIGVFGEWREHAAYHRTFATFGFSLEP